MPCVHLFRYRKQGLEGSVQRILFKNKFGFLKEWRLKMIEKALRVPHFERDLIKHQEMEKFI